MRYYDQSDIGKKREINQDLTSVVKNNKDQLLAVICDGMGGHTAGDLAAKMVVEFILKQFGEIDYFKDISLAKDWLVETIEDANKEVFNYSVNNVEFEGMGTTVVVVLVINEQVLITHIGDSRAYYIHESGCEQITTDHTYVNMLVEIGSISKEQAIIHPKRNVLMKAIGMATMVNPNVIERKITSGKLLLCTDGLYNGMDESEIGKIVIDDNLDIKNKVNKLIELTNESGGYDNIGIILIDFDMEDN